MILFKNFIFNKLPTYFRRNDSYKDSNDRGLLERYLEIFGDELDQEIIPEIENVLDILDAQIASTRFLTHLSDTLGNPPDINIIEPQYRNILSFIVDFYKIKGTKQGYEFFFGLFGYSLVITELPYHEAFYDNGEFYDTPNALGDYTYDNQCPTCSCYTIQFINKKDINGNIAPITPTDIANLYASIDFCEPINAVLCSLLQVVALEDQVNICLEETIKISTIDNILYDDGETYDSGDTYDETGSTLLQTLTDESPYCAVLVADFNNDFNNDFF
jgi:phage tail-like protein